MSKDNISNNPYKFLETFLDSVSEIDSYDFDENDTFDVYFLNEHVEYYSLGNRFENYIKAKADDDWEVSREKYPNEYTVVYKLKDIFRRNRSILFTFFETEDKSDLTIVVENIF